MLLLAMLVSAHAVFSLATCDGHRSVGVRVRAPSSSISDPFVLEVGRMPRWEVCLIRLTHEIQPATRFFSPPKTRWEWQAGVCTPTGDLNITTQSDGWEGEMNPAD